MTPAQRLADSMSHTLRWVLESASDPAVAAANWLARDVDPAYDSAVAMLSDPGVGLETLRRAKDVYKTMRIVGESAADRRLGARLYAGAIAAAIVRHDTRISSQSDAALHRGLAGLVEDQTIPDPLRTIAGTAICRLRQSTGG